MAMKVTHKATLHNQANNEPCGTAFIYDGCVHLAVYTKDKRRIYVELSTGHESHRVEDTTPVHWLEDAEVITHE